MLISSLAVGGLNGCGPGSSATRVAPAYTNNFYQPERGYYHAPFRAWYPLPYNHQDPQTRQFYQGGMWAATPHVSITNISPVTAEISGASSAGTAGGSRILRSGFGSSSHSSSISS